MSETKPPSPPLRRLADSGRGGFVGRSASFAAWVAVVAMLGVAAAGSHLYAPPAALAVAIAFLPFLFGALLLLLVVASLAFPARRSFPGLALVVTFAAVFLWYPRTSVDPVPPDGVKLRMASWNVRRLWGGPADGGDPAACVTDALRAQDPDVVTLLEVSAEDVDKLGAALSMRCVHHPYTEDGDREEGGLAVCTRGSRVSLGEGGGQRFLDEDDWYYVSAEVQVAAQEGSAARTLNVLAVHLFPYRYVARTIGKAVGGLTRGDPGPILEGSRAGELVAQSQSDHSAAMLARVERFRDPTLIGGDFNSTRDSALHASLRDRLVDTWEQGGTWYGPTVFLFDALPLRIDYVYSTPEFRTVTSAVPPVGCSDHRPVVTDLVLPAP